MQVRPADTHFGTLAAGVKDENANGVMFTGAAASGTPVIEAVGDDTNVDLEIKGKGTGSVISASAGRVTTAFTVLGAEAGNASLILDADEGDNDADTYTIASVASDNSLTISNHTTAVATISSAGLITAAGGVRSTSATAISGYATGAGGAQTQTGSASTTVVLSKPCGQITTVALTTAGAAEEEFTVTNTLVAATDVIALSTTYAGAGLPIAFVKTVTAGAFNIVITNVSASALNAVMVINFAVIKSVAA